MNRVTITDKTILEIIKGIHDPIIDERIWQLRQGGTQEFDDRLSSLEIAILQNVERVLKTVLHAGTPKESVAAVEKAVDRVIKNEKG